MVELAGSKLVETATAIRGQAVNDDSQDAGRTHLHARDWELSGCSFSVLS